MTLILCIDNGRFHPVLAPPKSKKKQNVKKLHRQHDTADKFVLIEAYCKIYEIITENVIAILIIEMRVITHLTVQEHKGWG